MIRAKNYESVSKFVKVMPRILWPLFFRGHGVDDRCDIMELILKVSFLRKDVKMHNDMLSVLCKGESDKQQTNSFD